MGLFFVAVTQLRFTFHIVSRKNKTTHLLQKLWASRKPRWGLLRTFKLCAESRITTTISTEGPSYIPRNQGCPSDYLDKLKKKSDTFPSDFCQKSFFWLIGTSLHGISERYFCFSELTTSGASMSHWKISNCFPNFFLKIMTIWQFLLLEPGSS